MRLFDLYWALRCISFCLWHSLECWLYPALLAVFLDKLVEGHELLGIFLSGLLHGALVTSELFSITQGLALSYRLDKSAGVRKGRFPFTAGPFTDVIQPAANILKVECHQILSQNQVVFRFQLRLSSHPKLRQHLHDLHQLPVAEGLRWLRELR